MRLYLALSAIAVVALAAVGTASAGGWASVRLAPPPLGLEAGETWRAEITVLRHAVTPTDGAKPTLKIYPDGGGSATSFRAKPVKHKTGVYVANVVFPKPGEWRYSVDNGLAATGYGVSATTTYGPVTIGSPAGGGDRSFPVLPIAAALAAGLGLAAAGAFAAVRLRRRPAIGH
jgi:YtkA-like